MLVKIPCPRQNPPMRKVNGPVERSYIAKEQRYMPEEHSNMLDYFGHDIYSKKERKIGNLPLRMYDFVIIRIISVKRKTLHRSLWPCI